MSIPRGAVSPSKRKHLAKDDPKRPMLIREVPESLRLAFKAKAAQEGLPMQAKLIELMTEYVNS